MDRRDMRRRGDEENPFNMPDDVYLDLIDYYERLKKRNAVDYKNLVIYILDTRQGKEWFETKYVGGNEFNLRQDLEEYFVHEYKGEPAKEGAVHRRAIYGDIVDFSIRDISESQLNKLSDELESLGLAMGDDYGWRKHDKTGWIRREAIQGDVAAALEEYGLVETKEGNMSRTDIRRRGAEAKTRKAVEMIHDIYPEDKEMLAQRFLKKLRQGGYAEQIENEAWEAMMELVHTGKHFDMFCDIVMEEGFAGNWDDASEIVMDMVEYWSPEVSQIIKDAISDVGRTTGLQY